MFCRRMRETQFSIDKRPAILILASLTTSIDSIENISSLQLFLCRKRVENTLYGISWRNLDYHYLQFSRNTPYVP